MLINMIKVISNARHLFPETGIYLKELKSCKNKYYNHRKRKLIFFPSLRSVGGGGSSDLRAMNIANWLENLGWDCIVVPAQLSLSQRQRIVKLTKPELAFIQQGTHLYNNPKYFKGLPYVFDIDDAYYLNERQFQHYSDLCKNAVGIIASSEQIMIWCKQFNHNVTKIWTGTIIPQHFPMPLPSNRLPIIAWPHHFIPGVNIKERLFLMDILDVVHKVEQFELWCFGVQNIDGMAEMENFCKTREIPFRFWPFVQYSKFNSLLCNVSIGLDLIDRDSEYNQSKSFGKVLAYLRSGVPTIVPRTAEYPYFFRNGENGFIVERSEEWSNAT